VVVQLSDKVRERDTVIHAHSLAGYDKLSSPVTCGEPAHANPASAPAIVTVGKKAIAASKNKK
jgi:hypothetical protein